jgi:formylglycine-generating enzyme required for sulfatase activity
MVQTHSKGYAMKKIVFNQGKLQSSLLDELGNLCFYVSDDLSDEIALQTVLKQIQEHLYVDKTTSLNIDFQEDPNTWHLKTFCFEQETLDFIECPQNETIPGFLIGQSAVTQHFWQTVMGNNPSYFNDNSQKPVDSLSWLDCIEFCNRCSLMKNLEPYYLIQNEKILITKSDGFRLPTEKEWEYAAKANTDFMYAGSNEIDEVAWYRGETQPVKQKKPNAWGLYDMSGNVWEWCDEMLQLDHSNQEKFFLNSKQILKGGSYWYYGDGKIIDRLSIPAYIKYIFYGLRIAKNLTGT